MRPHFQIRATTSNAAGKHVVAFGVRIGYWPCLKAPFLQITVGIRQVEFWFGNASYLPKVTA